MESQLSQEIGHQSAMPSCWPWKKSRQEGTQVRHLQTHNYSKDTLTSSSVPQSLSSWPEPLRWLILRTSELKEDVQGWVGGLAWKSWGFPPAVQKFKLASRVPFPKPHHCSLIPKQFLQGPRSWLSGRTLVLHVWGRKFNSWYHLVTQHSQDWSPNTQQGAASSIAAYGPESINQWVKINNSSSKWEISFKSG